MIDISKKYNGKTIKSAEWKITYKCDYKCDYCFQKNIERVDCDKDVVEKVLEFFSKQKEQYLIKLIGGEVFFNKDFLFICESLIKSGHKICIGTNMSASLQKFERFIELCGENLEFITASYHQSQVNDLNLFVEKAVNINKSVLPQTDFIVTSVLTEDSLDHLKELEVALKKEGVRFRYQRLKENGNYGSYPKETENLLENRWIDNSQKIYGWESEGTICNAGYDFINIGINGDVYRCYNVQKHYHRLGSMVDGSFRFFDKPLPCFSKICTCTVPINRGMILNKKEKMLTSLICDVFGCYKNRKGILF